MAAVSLIDERRKTYEWLQANGFQATRVIPDSKGWYEPKGIPSAGKPGYEVPELKAWGPKDGIGALLGARFGGLIDADYDCPAARGMAHWFFPPSPATFGRKSTPKAHGLYRISGDEPFPTLQTKLPGKQQHGEGKTMLLELRGDVQDNGVHTVLPGSRHKGTAEEIRYEGQGPGALPLTDRAVLLAAFYEHSVACLIAEGGLYPEHARHDLCAALSGMLMRLKWEQPRVLRVLSAVTEYLGADKIHLKQVAQTFEKAKDPKKRLYGKPMVLKLLTGDKQGNDTVNPIIALIEECTLEGKQPKAAEGGRRNNINNSGNVREALEKSGIELYFDEWTRRALVSYEGGEPQALNKAARLDIWGKLEDDLGLCFNRAYLDDRITVMARRNKRHSLLDTVRAVTWDGVKRAETLFIDIINAKDTPLVRAATLAWLVGAARKVLKPGTRTRVFPVFEGKQGIGKSEMIKMLAINPEWYTEDLDLLAPAREIIEQSRGKLFADQGELSRIKGKDYERVKDALTRTADCASLKYDPEAETYPRMFSSTGSHNPTGGPILMDPSGNTRFIPFPTEGFPYEGQAPDAPNRFRRDELARDVLQIWAEVFVLEAEGHPHDLPGHVYEQLKAESEERAAENPWEDIIISRVAHHIKEQIEEADKRRGPAPAKIMVASCTILEHWLSIPIERQSPAAGAKVSEIMYKLGYAKGRLPGANGNKGPRGYVLYAAPESKEPGEPEKPPLDLDRLRKQKSKLMTEAAALPKDSPERAKVDKELRACTKLLKSLEERSSPPGDGPVTVIREMPPGAPEI